MGYSTEMSLGMVFIVALSVTWCRCLECLEGASLQLYADNLKCTSHDIDNLQKAAQKNASHGQVVGQEASLAGMRGWRDCRAGGGLVC